MNIYQVIKVDISQESWRYTVVVIKANENCSNVFKTSG